MTTWDELTKVYKAKVHATPAANSLTVEIDGVTDILNVPVTLATDDVQYWIAYNVAKSNAIFVTTNSNDTEPVLTSECIIGSGLLAWAENDVLVLYRMQGICDIDTSGTPLTTFFKQGFIPHIQWLPTEELNKVNLYLGSSASTPVMQYPLRIQKGVNTINGTLWTGSSYQLGVRSGWYIDIEELTDKCVKIGGPTTPIPLLTGFTNVTTEVGEGIQITHGPSILSPTPVAADCIHTRWYITLLYRSLTAKSFYEESDPIWKLYLSAVTSTGHGGQYWPAILLSVGIDLSRLSKSISGFRVYAAYKTATELGGGGLMGGGGVEPGNLALWFDEGKDYQQFAEPLLARSTVKVTEFLFEEPGSETGYDNLVRDTTTRFVYSYGCEFSGSDLGYIGGPPTGSSIQGNLGHEPDLNRTRLKPRFATKVVHTDSSAIVIDQDDRTARSSAIGQAPMDDSFPDLSTSAAGYRLKFDIGGKGDLMGLRFSLNQLVAFKRNWINFVDTQASTLAGDYLQPQLGDRTVRGDVSSRRGIVEFPKGLAWFGHTGIFMKPHGENSINNISGPIQNFIDGTLLTPDGTPYLIDTYRENAVGGYSPYLDAIWWNIKANVTKTTTEYINLRYSVAGGNWDVRPLGIGGGIVNWFDQRKDNTLTLGTNSGMLKYPNIESDSPYQDGVASNDTASGLSFETRIQLNLGFLSELPFGGTLSEIQIYCEGESSSGYGMFELRLMPEGDEFLLSAPHGVPIDGRFSDRPIGVEPVGSLKSCFVDLRLPTGYEYLFGKWAISKIVVWYTESLT